MEDEEYQEHERILDKTTGKLKDWMIPDLIIDADHENKIFGYREKRDIQQQKTTTEKNDLILKIVRRKNKNGYKDFIEILHRTRQEKLVEFLTRTENGQETGEIESHLDEMAKESLNLSPNYFKLKSGLKEDLIVFYKTRHSRVPLSPLFKENDTPLETFYIRPEIKEKPAGTKATLNTVKTLSDMFKFENKVSKEIYLSADAGLGKTTFSKYLATSWCQANCSGEKDKKIFERKDIDCMHEFEFLFLVLLRDSSDLCSIDDIIFELLISFLAHSENFDKSFLQEILNHEKCLVILDGLDEWTHPEHPRKYCHSKQRSIPHRNLRQHCTVLTTTRPWKLGVLNPRDSNEFGKQVILDRLSNDSIVILTRRTLKRLKSLPDDYSLTDEVDKFNKVINARGNVDLASVPLLLMYIICLWCEDVPIGNSKCELYLNIVELLLSRTAATHGELQSSGTPPNSILEYVTGHSHCKKYFTLLMTLGELAYHTLVSDKRENTLVFDKEVAEKYLTDDDMIFSLHSGILTETTNKTLIKQTSKVSFSHKTVQEFFAAIFISSQSEGQKTVVEKCTSIQSILDMSTICLFISGMNATMISEISKGFMSVINEDEETRKYRSRTSDEYFYRNTLYHVQKMLLSWFEEMPGNKKIQLFLQDLFIPGYREQDFKSLSKLNKNSIQSLYMEVKPTSRKLREIIELSSLRDLNCLQKLCYVGDVQETEIHCLLSSCLQRLCLYCGKWTNYEGNLSVTLEQIQNLQYLFISEFRFSHEILETFLNFISSKKTLKEVNLYGLFCNTHSYCGNMKLDFSEHSQLTKVIICKLPPLQIGMTTPSLVNAMLGGIDLDVKSLLLSPKMLNIECVDLLGITVSAKSLKHFEDLDNPHSV